MKKYKISLKNNKYFTCDSDTTIFDAAKKAGIFLNHSCLSARCSSCIAKVISGETKNREEEFILSTKEKKENFVLSCNAKPLTNLNLDIEDLGEIILYDKKIIPSKINHIEKLNDDVLKVVLRLPPNSNFNYNSGQYVNIIKGNLVRSYSIANSSDHKIFHRENIPFIYFGVEDHKDYHRHTDTYATINQNFYIEAVKVIIRSIENLDEYLYDD